jgi:hypothetical protein
LPQQQWFRLLPKTKAKAKEVVEAKATKEATKEVGILEAKEVEARAILVATKEVGILEAKASPPP